jgi:hypothetical protein
MRRLIITAAATLASTAFLTAGLAAPSALAAAGAPSAPAFFSGTNTGCPDPVTSSGGAGPVSPTAAQLTSVCYGYGGVYVTYPATTTFSQFTTLSTDYTMTQGQCGGGAPRFEVDMTNGDFFTVYFGTQPYGGCSPNTPSSMDATSATAGWFVGYSNTPETYAQVEATYGSDVLQYVQIIEDGGWSQQPTDAQQVLIKNWNVNGTSFYSPPVCTQTGLSRDGINLTAAVINPSSTVTGTVDASGCNIGVYYGPRHSGSVTNANVSGANYYGVVANAAAVTVTGSTIHNIGESPFNGTQHGVGVLYTTIDQTGASTGASATGTLSGSTITNYQKNGVVVSGAGASATVKNNTVTGLGPVNFIAQNGIEIAFGGSAAVTGNTVSGHYYTPATVTACGLLFYQAGGVKQSANILSGNQTNLCNAGRGGGNTSA